MGNPDEVTKGDVKRSTISAEQSNIILGKEIYDDGYCSGNHNQSSIV